ncbi:MAG: N-acetylmuramoyl-L-alanine amidase [Thermomicrobiales bacterium]|nr:N-acetylmuramoyl-L-alanine amidase [Thermomicrobiales bacterium]
MSDLPRRPRPHDDPNPSWQTGPYDPLPKRTRARKQIPPIYQPVDPHVDVSAGRKLSRDERSQLRERYEERRTPPPAPPARRVNRQKQGSKWWTKAAVFGLFAILVGSIGAGRFFAGDATPTVPAAFVTATLEEASIFITPSPTATATPTETATPEPSPTFTPTPDPRYVGLVVCLDPGHGGSDRGFKREDNGVAPAMEEAFYNLAYARILRTRLETLGFTVVMTRETDIDVNASGADVNGDGKTYDNLIDKDPQGAERAKDLDELQARINVCNDADADLLVSMHINGFDDPAAQGYETWYSADRPFADRNKLFAQYAFQELGQEMADAGYNARPRLVNDDSKAHVAVSADSFDSYVITGPEQPGQIEPSAMPGAIVEVLFISNDQDAAFLASSDGRNAIVKAYLDAIVRYFDAIAE